MVLVWLIRIAICLSFVYEGYTKIVSRRFQYDFFVQFLKYPKEFMIPVGVFELIFALLCIVKPSVGIVMLHFDMGLYAHAVFFRVHFSFILAAYTHTHTHIHIRLNSMQRKRVVFLWHIFGLRLVF